MDIKNMIKNINMKNFLNSNGLRPTLYILGAATMLLIVFQAGIFIGYRKAEFSYRWGDNYARTFGEPKSRFPSFPGMTTNRFASVNGITGKIININNNELVVAGNDKIERLVIIDASSSVRRFREEIKPSELKVDDSIVVIGSPDEKGMILAKLIRLIPPQKEIMSADINIRIK